jgi:hypothetical protein
MKTTVALSLALALLLPVAASAAPNDGVVTYSGFLRNAAGNPETGTQSLTFTLYDAASAGNAVWTQTVSGVQPDSTGWFSVVLGASPAAFPPGEFLSQAWLAIKVGAEPEMAPRTKLGAAPYALASDHAGLSGCTAANQILQWNGTGWACIATPAGTGGFTPPACATGQVMKWNGSAWACDADLDSGLAAVSHDASLAGTGTAGSPLALAAGAVKPSSLAGTVGATGQVATKAATDAWIWVTPLAAPAAACAPPVPVLTWTGTAFSCVADANSGGDITAVAAGAGLVGGSISGLATLAVDFAGTGTAATAARSDHTHPIIQTVPLADLLLDATSIVQTVTMGSSAFVKSRAVTVPAGGSAQDAISGFAPMPISANPTLRATIHNPTAVAVTYTFNFFSSGIASGRPIPDSRWSNSSSSVTIAGGGVGVVQKLLNAQAVTSACATANNCPMAAAGDMIWFSFGANPGTAYNVLGIQLLF